MVHCPCTLKRCKGFVPQATSKRHLRREKALELLHAGQGDNDGGYTATGDERGGEDEDEDDDEDEDRGGPNRLHDLVTENASLKNRIGELELALRQEIEEDEEFRDLLVELDRGPPKADGDWLESDSDTDSEGISEDSAASEEEPAQHNEDLRPLFPNARASVMMTLLHLFQWKLEYLVTDAAFSALLTLLCHLLLPAGNLLPATLYLCERALGSDRKKRENHACINEDHLFPYLEKREWVTYQDEKCPRCGERRFDQRLRPRNRFYTFPVIPQLRAFFGRELFCQYLDDMAAFIKTNPSPEESFFGGSLAKRISGPDKFLEDPASNLVLSAGLDGVQCFLKGNNEVWLLALRIRNLPTHVMNDREFRLQAAIFSPSKRVDPYVEPLFLEIDDTFKGIQMKNALRNEQFLLSLRLLTVEADHMGTCLCGCFNPPSSHVACWCCWASGKANPQTKRGSYFDGFLNGQGLAARRRTDEETRRLGEKACNPVAGDPECDPSRTGISGVSPFVRRCRDFDAVWSFAPEPFHALYENMPKIIFNKAIFLEYKKGEECPPYTMKKADRKIFSKRIDAARKRTPRGMKKLADPSQYSLKGDEWADFIVVSMLYAVEGLVSKEIYEILSLLRESFILCTQVRVMKTASITAIHKKLGRLIERTLPVTCRPITTHRVLAHFAESIQHTGPLIENLGQWIEDECLTLVSQTRRREIKINPDATLSKTLALKHLLREKHQTLDALENYLPLPRPVDPKFHDAGENGTQLLGAGSFVVMPAAVLSAIAKLLSILLKTTKANVSSELPKQMLEFRSALTPLDINSKKAANADDVGVLFNERNREVEYFGQVWAFYKFDAFGKTYRVAHLALLHNTTPSTRGLPRISQEYSNETVVELSAFTRRVLIVKREPADNFFNVLTLRHHLPMSYTS